MVDLHLNICGCNEVNTFIYEETDNFPADKFCTPTQAYDCGKIKLNKTQITEKCFDPDECREVCQYWRYESTVTVGPVVRSTLEPTVLKFKKSNKTYRKAPKKRPHE